MLPPTATVLEYLVFVAEIVLTPLGIARDERRQAVERLLDAFQLHRVRHSMIGDHSRRGISGGEMRRVSVAVGLLARPSVVFLDEPTTGLDSHNAMQLLHLLHRWANSMGSSAATPVGSSVAKPPPIVLSIHQPSPRLFRHFHRIMVLGTNGRVLFTGQPEQMVPFFLSLSIAHQKQLFSTSTVSDNGKEHTRKDGDTTDQVPDLNEQPGVLVNKEDTHDNQISSGAATDETKISVDGSSDASTEIDNSGSPNPSTPGPDVVESEVDNPAEFALQWCAEAEAVGSLDTVANAFKDWDKIKDSTPKSQDAVDVQPNSNSTLLAQQLALFGGGGGGGRQVGLLQTLQEGDVRNEGENDSVCPRQPGCGERGYCLELTLLLHRDFEEVLRDFQVWLRTKRHIEFAPSFQLFLTLLLSLLQPILMASLHSLRWDQCSSHRCWPFSLESFSSTPLIRWSVDLEMFLYLYRENILEKESTCPKDSTFAFCVFVLHDPGGSNQSCWALLLLVLVFFAHGAGISGAIPCSPTAVLARACFEAVR